MEEILTIRQEQAQLIGYADYAQMALGRRMADSPEAALDFLRDLATKARSHAEEEMAELRAFAADKLAIKNLQAWDVSFASEHLRRSKYNFSDAELRPYLNENRVLAGVFDCARGFLESTQKKPKRRCGTKTHGLCTLKRRRQNHRRPVFGYVCPQDQTRRRVDGRSTRSF